MQPLHSNLTARLLAASGLGVVALVAGALHSSPTDPGTDRSLVLEDWMYSHGGSRHVQYDLVTSELLLVGEVAHGLDYFSGSGGFWYCGFGGHASSPILSFLLRESTVEHHEQPDYYPRGLELPYIDVGEYGVIRLEPLHCQATYVNKAGQGTRYPGDYNVIPNDQLEFFLYQRVDGSFNIAVMHAGVDQEAAPGEAEGDGSANKDNGVRMDIAFRAHLPLPAEKLRWTQHLDANSAAYETEHPNGF